MTNFKLNKVNHPISHGRSPRPAKTGLLNWKTVNFTVLVTLLLSLASISDLHANNSRANRNIDAGVLDQPLVPQGTQISRQEAQRLLRAQRQAARAERQRLRRLSRAQRRAEAENGDRLAQLVLAEEFAEEAQQWSAIPDVANDALSDAARWYSLAAKRGYPGAPAVDKVLPAMPMRVARKR